MKRSMWLVAVAVLALGAQGGPLKPELVPAQATWFVHLDVEKLLASQVGAQLLDAIKAEPKFSAQLDKIQATVGVDLRKDIKGLSLFGPDAHIRLAIAAPTGGQDHNPCGCAAQADRRTALEQVVHRCRQSPILSNCTRQL